MDFEADLSTMCSEIRRCMAADFPEDFDPDIVLEPGNEHMAVNNEEYEFDQELEEQKRQIRSGHQRTILVVLNLATVQLLPSAPNSIIVIALGKRLCL